MLKPLLFSAISITLVAQSPSAPIIGRILDSNGKAIKDATVSLQDMYANLDLSKGFVVQSDTSGAFSIAAPTGEFALTVTSTGCEPHFQSVLISAEAIKPLEIKLKKGGIPVKGRLKPAKGLDLKDVRIFFFHINGGKGSLFTCPVKNGSFEVYLHPGKHFVAFEAKGQAGSQILDLKEPERDLILQLKAKPTKAPAEVPQWIQANAIPIQTLKTETGLADLKALKPLIGDATVVGLGEATHGTREFFQLKHRIFEFLVKEMGFRVFALEANQPEAEAINAYIQTGQGDPIKALDGLYFWTWNTQEMLDLIEWMRAYNAQPNHKEKLKFYGIDMQTETVAFSQVMKWLRVQAPKEADRLQTYADQWEKLPRQFRDDPTPKDLETWFELSKKVSTLRNELANTTPQDAENGRQIQNLNILSQWLEMQSRSPYEVRNRAMADNLQWIQKHEKGSKIVLWAHNGHISASPGAIAGTNGMGWHLRQSLQTAYRPLSLAFFEGSFRAVGIRSPHKGLQSFEVKTQRTATLDAALAISKYPIYALNLSILPASGPVHQWFFSPQGTWNIGAMFNPAVADQFISEDVLPEGFDGLLFIKQTTPTRPVQKTMPTPSAKPDTGDKITQNAATVRKHVGSNALIEAPSLEDVLVLLGRKEMAHA